MPEFIPSKTAAVDVDGTLLINGVPQAKAIEWCRQKKRDGWSLILWSAAGRDHALRAAVLCGLDGAFVAIIAKPSVILDDIGWSWIKHTCVIRAVE